MESNMMVLILAIFIFIGGIVLVIFSSKYAVKHSALLATALGISPLIIGVTLVSIGLFDNYRIII